MDSKLTPTEFIDAVCAQVRFKPDRPGIARELTAHLEDRAEMLMAHGFDEDTAQARAVGAMGDAEEIGRELDKEHSPFWGWAARLTDLFRFISLGVLILLVLGAPGGLKHHFYQQSALYADQSVLLDTIPIQQWHETDHFRIFFSQAEIRRDPKDGLIVVMDYNEWYKNPFFHTPDRIICQEILDESGTDLLRNYDYATLNRSGASRPTRLEFVYDYVGRAYAVHTEQRFSVTVELDWEGIE